MELEVFRNELADALRKVTSIISTRTTLPILSNVLFSAKGDRLTLNASNLDISILVTINAQISREGEATLPAKKLLQMVSMAPGETISFSSDENYHTTICSNRARFCLHGMNPAEFVRLEDRDDSKLILRISMFELKKMFQKITYAVNEEEPRYLLRGICLSLKEGTCTVVGTDGKRLSLVEKVLDTETEFSDEEYILPIRLVKELEKLMGDEGEAEIYINKTEVTFRFNGTVVNAKLIEGKYPAFRQVIPTSFEYIVEVDRQQLLDIIGRVSLVIAMPEENPIKFVFKENELLVQASSPDLGEAEEPIEIQRNGKDSKEVMLMFNPTFISDVLRHLECNRIIMKFSESYRPMVLVGDEGFLGVVMPRCD